MYSASRNMYIYHKMKRRQKGSVVPPPSISSHYTSCYYGPFVCSSALIIGSHFGTPSSFKHIPRLYRLLHPGEQLAAEGRPAVQKDPDDRLQNRADGTFWWENVLVYIPFLWLEDEFVIELIFFLFDRFTFKDLLSSRLLWVPSLWPTAAYVSIICNATTHKMSESHTVLRNYFKFWHSFLGPKLQINREHNRLLYV